MITIDKILDLKTRLEALKSYLDVEEKRGQILEEEKYTHDPDFWNDQKKCSEFSYGCTLIEEDDFEDYCEELVIDCGYIPKDFPSWIEIDWEATASNMKQDYSELDYQGITYLFRA